MSEAQTGPPRIVALDGLRACAVLAVFLSHAFRIRMLWIGVDLFFVLSGFLITGILLDLKQKDVRGYFSHFYERRARRILPPYVLLLVVGSLVFGLSWMRRWYLYFGLMNYVWLFPKARFLPFNPLWSLGVEEQFYLVWPFAVYFLNRKALPWVLLGLVVIAPILRVLVIPYDWTHELVYMGTPFRMDCLAMGGLLTFVWRAKGDAVRKYGYLGLIPVAVTPLLMIWLNRLGGYSTTDPTVRSHVVTFGVALLAATGAFLWGLGGRYVGILEWSPLQFLGRISYTFYLVHLGALMFFEEYYDNRWIVAGLGLAVSLAYATASWFWVERPILDGGSRRVAGVEVAAARG